MGDPSSYSGLVSDVGQQLMLRFQAGETNAFHLIFLEYKNSIFHLAFRFLNDADLADEITQDVFLRIYESKESYKPSARFSTWIYRIASNVCLNTIRDRRRETSLDAPLAGTQTPADYADQTTPSVEKEVSNAQVSQGVARVLQSLPETQRILVLLVYYENLSITDAAKTLQIPAVSARLRLFRARRVLANKLRPFL